MRDWITKDFWCKLFSVILAVAIWLTVHKVREEPVGSPSLADNTLTYTRIPVRIVSTGADMSQYRLAPSVVSVTVSGPSEVMGVLQANQIRAAVDLSDLETNPELKRRVEVAVPFHVTLISVDPQKIGVIIPPKP